MSPPPTPIALFAYRRPLHLRRTLAALAACEGAAAHPLTVFCDAAASEADSAAVAEVRRVAAEASGFAGVEVVAAPQHRGLAASVMGGVSRMLEVSDRVIVVEDDLRLHPEALRFLEAGLEAYAENSRIGCICASCPRLRFRGPQRQEVWLSRRNLSHGWAIWADRWRQVDWALSAVNPEQVDPAMLQQVNLGGADLGRTLMKVARGEGDLWAVRLSFALVRHGWSAVLPPGSYVENLGHDGSGKHALWNPLRRWLRAKPPAVFPRFPPDPQPDAGLQKQFARSFWPHAVWEKLRERV